MNRSRLGAMWTGRRWTRAAAVLVAVLAVESGLLLLAGVQPPLSASVHSSPSGAGLIAEVSLRNGPAPISVDVSLVPGRLVAPTDDTVLFLADSQLPSLYSPFSTTLSVGVRVSGYLQLMGSPLRVVDVSTADVAGALASHPSGTLVMVGTGVIPDTLFGTNVSTLRSWIAGGGTLVWAGGPLGYSEGHPTPSGFVYDSLGWAGQTSFFGFPLSDPVDLNATDPAAFPPLFGTVATPLGADLGLQYSGTASGANVTEVDAHGGVALGIRTSAGSSGSVPSPRTSLAYVPLGAGCVWYFGGAMFFPPVGYIPQASVNLSADIALVLGRGYQPVAGPSESRTVSLGPLASATVALSVPDRSLGVVATVRAQTEGALLYYFAETLAAPRTSGPRPPIGADRSGPPQG